MREVEGNVVPEHRSIIIRGLPPSGAITPHKRASSRPRSQQAPFSVVSEAVLQWRRGHNVPRQFDVVIERDSEGYYVASVPQIPACHTQARSLDEVTERIREAIALCLEVERAPEQQLEFIGIQR